MISAVRENAQSFVRHVTRHGDRTIGTAGLVLLAAYLFAMLAFPRADGRVVVGDATHHFVQLHSMLFDRDLHFRNDYTRIYRLQGGEPGTEWVTRDFTATGYVRNYMPVGPALLWAPLYVMAVGAYSLLALLGLVARPDGFEPILQLAPGVSGILAATAAAWVAWRTAARYASAGGAIVATLATWLGTHALYYSLVSPAYSHTASMLTSALFFSAWLSWRQELSLGRGAMLGALAGACALMRWQDALFVIVPLYEVFRREPTWPRRCLAWTVVSAAWLVVFSPQMIVWQVLYGQPFALPQGPSFMQWTRPHLLEVLVSDNHGLLSWAPLLVFAFAGLVTFARINREVAVPFLFLWLSSWYVNGAVADWWAGEAFGARRFLSLFPLFVLGLAVWLDGKQPQVSTWRVAVAAAMVALNVLLLLQYQLALKGLEQIAPYPQGADLWLPRFLVPFRLLAWWAS